MTNLQSTTTWRSSPAIQCETCERTIALWNALGSLFERAGASVDLASLASGSDDLLIRALSRLGWVAERAANADVLHGSDEDRERLASLRCASSLARLLRMSVRLRRAGASSAERMLDLAEVLVGSSASTPS